MDEKKFLDKEYFNLYLNLIPPDPAHPETLYHYTSSQGLLGILQEHRLWATHLEFMNDPTELKHTISLVEELTYSHTLSLKQEQPLFSELLDGIFKSIESHAHSFQFFAICFCEDEGDTLGQWRAYGDMGSGYSIGFSVQDLQENELAESPGPTHLVKVVYSREEQTTTINNLLSELFGSLQRIAEQLGEERARKQFGWMKNLLLLNLTRHLYSFKNPKYSEEQEWRIVTWLKSDSVQISPDESPAPPDTSWDQLHFRPARHFVIPYIKLNLCLSEADRLPIVEIVQGPRPQPKLGVRALEMMKNKQGYAMTRIRRSVIPLR